MQSWLQTPWQISILLLASPHQQFPFSVSKARVAMEIECQGKWTSCWKTVAQVELWANGNQEAPWMATASSPEGKWWQSSWYPQKGSVWEMQDAVSGTSLRQGMILILFLPHTCHRTDLVFSLFLHLRTLAIQKAAWGDQWQSHFVVKASLGKCLDQKLCLGLGEDRLTQSWIQLNHSNPHFQLALCRIIFLYPCYHAGRQPKQVARSPIFPLIQQIFAVNLIR